MTENLDRHLTPEELAEFIDDRLDSRMTVMARLHIQACGDCRAELALARSFQEQADVVLPPEVDARIKATLEARSQGAATGDHDEQIRPRRGRILPFDLTWARAGLLAASVVFAVLGLRGVADRPTTLSPGGEMRSAGVDSVWEIDLSETAAGVIRASWGPQEGAEGYQLEIRSASGEVLWSHEVDGSSAEIRFDQLAAELQDQRALFVSVRARLSDGSFVVSRPRALPAFP